MLDGPLENKQGKRENHEAAVPFLPVSHGPPCIVGGAREVSLIGNNRCTQWDTFDLVRPGMS